jgi:predicted ATPase
MIKEIRIRNFKVHDQLQLDLGNLTVLTGVNSSGKSSIIQAMLLLRQSNDRNVLKDGLQLNGDYCRVGLVKDAICRYSEDGDLGFCFTIEDDSRKEWRFRINKGNDFNRDFIPIFENGESSEESFSLFGKNFHYISAARWSPRESYPMDSHAVEGLRRLSLQYGQCELAVHYLDYYKKEKVEHSLMIHPQSDGTLLSEVSKWESDMGMKLEIVPKNLGSTTYGLYYRYEDPLFAEETRADNVGYGLSYALPIIIALLSTPKGGLVVIENPEAHLHPKAIAKMAELISLAAVSGVQVIVETHSDHIINGIMVQVKKKIFSGSLPNIYFMQKREESLAYDPVKLEVTDDGNIINPPKDFFDQIELDLGQIIGI